MWQLVTLPKSQMLHQNVQQFFYNDIDRAEEPKLGKHFTKLGQLASAATSIFMGAESNSRGARGDVSEKNQHKLEG